MTDRHLAADVQFCTLGTEFALVGDVQYAAVLDIGVIADADPVDVAANYGQRPDRAVFAHFDVADNDGRLVDIAVCTDTRGSAPETANHCFAPLEETRIVTIFSRRASVFGETNGPEHS